MNSNIPTENSKELVGYALLAGAICLIGYVIKAAHNMNAVADKVGKSVDEIAHSTRVDVSEAVVNEAVRQVAERETLRIVARATECAIADVRGDIRKEVKAAVDKAYQSVESDVRRELKRQAEKLDIDDLKAEIIEKAKETASEKLDEALDGILDDFNGNLKNIAKIYKSINRAITGED